MAGSTVDATWPKRTLIDWGSDTVAGKVHFGDRPHLFTSSSVSWQPAARGSSCGALPVPFLPATLPPPPC